MKTRVRQSGIITSLLGAEQKDGSPELIPVFLPLPQDAYGREDHHDVSLDDDAIELDLERQADRVWSMRDYQET